MPMTPREMIKYLKKNGFEEIRQNGSYITCLLYTSSGMWQVVLSWRRSVLRFPGKHSGIGYIKDFVKGYKAVFFI